MVTPSPVPSPVAPPVSVGNPQWKDKILGHVRFDTPTESEKSAAISGKEFLSLVRPLERAVFDQLMRQQGKKDGFEKLYQDYLQNLVDQGLGILLLNRVMDHEIKVRKFPEQVSDLRVLYVKRAILTQNAILKDKVHSHMEIARDWTTPNGCSLMSKDGKPELRRIYDEDVSERTDSEMYAWLQETVGERSVRFNMDWTFKEAGLEGLHELLYSQENRWRPITLNFQKMPETLQEFESQLREKMQPFNRILMRQIAWRTMALERNPFIDLRTVISVDPTEMARVYGLLKDQLFKSVAFVDIAELSISGAQSVDFYKRFVTLHNEREEQLRKEFIGNDPSNPIPPGELEKRKTALRKSVPGEILTILMAEFTQEIQKGTVKISMRDRELEAHALDLAFPDGSSMDSKLKEQIFRNPLFFMAILPKIDLGFEQEGCLERGVFKIVLFKETRPGKPDTFLDINEPRVVEFLNTKLQNKFQSRVFRDLAHDLLIENNFEIENDTCSDPAWPCINLDAKHRTEALFAEVLYPGESLGVDENGNPISSTLGRYDLNGRVSEISLDLFGKVFEIF